MIESGTYLPYKYLGMCKHAGSFSLQHGTHKDSLAVDGTRKAYKTFFANGKRYVTVDTMIPV